MLDWWIQARICLPPMGSQSWEERRKHHARIAWLVSENFPRIRSVRVYENLPLTTREKEAGFGFRPRVYLTRRGPGVWLDLVGHIEWLQAVLRTCVYKVRGLKPSKFVNYLTRPLLEIWYPYNVFRGSREQQVQALVGCVVSERVRDQSWIHRCREAGVEVETESETDESALIRRIMTDAVFEKRKADTRRGNNSTDPPA